MLIIENILNTKKGRKNPMAMNKLKSALSLTLCLSMLVMPTMAFAAEATTVDSVGSVAADMNASDPTGKDTTQNKKSEYVDVNKGELGDKTVNVYASKGPVYTVKIPQTIILNGSDGTGVYQVAVKGDIEGTKQVTVKPDASFELTQAGKENVTATVTQTKQKVVDDEMELDSYATTATFEGSISAADVTAGSWNGTFTMHISYDNKAE